MTRRGALALVLLLGTAPALQGCVVAAIPAVAGAVVARKQVGGDKDKDRKPVPETVAAPAPAPDPALASAQPPQPVPGPAPAYVPEPALAPSPAPERTPVFAGEPAARVTLAPNAFAGLPAQPQPGPRLRGANDIPANLVTPEPAAPVAAVDAPFRPEPAAAPAAPAALPEAKRAFAAPPPRPAAPEALQPLSPMTVLPPAPAVEPVPAPPSPSPAPAPLVTSRPPASRGGVTGPVPAAPAGGKGYLGFTSYALAQGRSPQADAVLGVVDAADPLAAPRRAQCGGQAPAVMIDLDPGLSFFDPSAAKPQTGLAEALSALRAAGLTIIWISALPVEQSEAVYAALARTGLDPTRTDRLLLLKGAGDRKQARRLTAARAWCVVAMAGDRRGDFDEAFDYLLDPETKIPADSLFGDGWFVAPPPLP